MSTVQLPRLLDDNLLEITRLHPDKLSVDLLLSSVSTANMSVSQDEEKIEVGQFIELFTAQGSAGIFVVKSVAYDPDMRRQDVYLEHGVATLANNLMEGEEDKEGTARELLTALLACQTRRLWQLGTVESSETLKWSCDYSNVLESIVNLMEQLPTYALTFDQTSMPWVLNLVRMSDADACECRLTRNMESLTVDIDRTDLCTRLYIRGIGKKKKPEEDKPPDEGEGESPGEGDGDDELPPLEDFVLPPQDQLVERYSETIEADTMATWGIVERVLEADMELPFDELMRQGRIYLEERKNPSITITLDAFDLYQATGEPFDRFHLGRICRVCLPEYAAVIRHRVVGMTYTDALAEPERVTLTLATQRADGIDTIAGIIVNTTLHSEQIGRLQINKIVANGLLELLADQIRLHAKHILLEAEKIELLAKEILLQAEEIKMLADRVEINAENIRLWGEITDELRESFAEINIDVENALIELRAGLKEITDMGDRISNAEILIDGANAKIDLYAKRTDETIEGLDRRITSAEILIDGANAAIMLKASQEDVDDLDRRITSAEIDIDGANARIDLKASQEDVEDLGDDVDALVRRMASAEIAIDGANARIDLITGSVDLGDLEKRISDAEIAIDGANAAIALKANVSTVTALSDRVSSTEDDLVDYEERLSYAEVDINGLESEISLKANASTVTALGDRVSSAELSINGLESEITLKANKIDLQGYVTAGELETEIVNVANAGVIETLVAGFIASGDINAETVNCDSVNTGPVDCTNLTADVVSTETLWATAAFVDTLVLGGSTVSSGSQTIVTSLNGLDKTYADLWYMDADGNEQHVRVLTNVENRWPNQMTLNYLTV